MNRSQYKLFSKGAIAGLTIPNRLSVLQPGTHLISHLAR
jgi:hypothetical protein